MVKVLRSGTTEIITKVCGTRGCGGVKVACAIKTVIGMKVPGGTIKGMGLGSRCGRMVVILRVLGPRMTLAE